LNISFQSNQPINWGISCLTTSSLLLLLLSSSPFSFSFYLSVGTTFPRGPSMVSLISSRCGAPKLQKNEREEREKIRWIGFFLFFLFLLFAIVEIAPRQ